MAGINGQYPSTESARASCSKIVETKVLRPTLDIKSTTMSTKVIIVNVLFQIRSVVAPNLCVDTKFQGTEHSFGLEECVNGTKRKHSDGNEQFFQLTWHKDIRPKGRTVCWDVSSLIEKAPVNLYSCHGMKGNQLWRYNIVSIPNQFRSQNAISF